MFTIKFLCSQSSFVVTLVAICTFLWISIFWLFHFTKYSTLPISDGVSSNLQFLKNKKVWDYIYSLTDFADTKKTTQIQMMCVLMPIHIVLINSLSFVNGFMYNFCLRHGFIILLSDPSFASSLFIYPHCA